MGFPEDEAANTPPQYVLDPTKVIIQWYWFFAKNLWICLLWLLYLSSVTWNHKRLLPWLVGWQAKSRTEDSKYHRNLFILTEEKWWYLH